MKTVKSVKGITLVALAITIIVLLMLSGVVYVIADSLIIERATVASSEMTNAVKHEVEELKWAENWELAAENKNLLKDNVKVGDYVEYPIEYDDVYTGEHYEAKNAWRVIEVDSQKGVKIISTGIPVKWYHKMGDNEFIDHFEDLSDFRNFQKDYVRCKSFMVKGISSKIMSLTLADLNYYCNKIYGTNRSENETTPVPQTCELFYLSEPDTYYWLATNDKDDSSKLYSVENNAIVGATELRLGVRPVILLNQYVSGTFEDGVWKNIQ